MQPSITRAILIASLALGANAAIAANLPAHKTARVVPHLRVVHVAPALPGGPFNADIRPFIQSMLGGGPAQHSRLTRGAERVRPWYRSSGYSDGSPSHDTSPAIDTGSSASDAAASDAAMQSLNDENALNASMAAAEAQNEAAQAAAIQTEINANN